MKKKLTTANIIAEVAGWYGALALIAAYALVSFSVIAGDGVTFQLLNLTGAMGIIVIASYKKVRQSVVLNIFWGIVALVALVRIFMS